MRKRHTSLKGTWEYSAERLIQSKAIVVGQQMKLRREPGNKYDRHACSVYCERSKVGYLPKNLAAEISSYLDGGGKYSTVVTHIGKRTRKGQSYPSVSVDLVLYGMSEQPGIAELQNAANALKKIRGIYNIHSVVENKGYVGSSADVGKRLTTHLNQLINGKHANHKMSDAWIRHGAQAFQFKLVERVPNGSLLERERHHIGALQTFSRGYNHSSDGEGKAAAPAAKVAQLAAQENTLGWMPNSATTSIPTQSAAQTPPVVSSTQHQASASPPKGSGCMIMMLFASALIIPIILAASEFTSLLLPSIITTTNLARHL